ncbi:AF4/FMR2 family member 1 isoform X2 [Gouania willdenowi]|uniref:AF4/FMR2 family member lilli n=1 Tax=Gouania willdenowi TaxID=441366 RepID=A0A8C5EF60_GOUWI|nr:AF4/FMR2 family member 1-like isoform X2 [Gouania willdenowi]
MASQPSVDNEERNLLRLRAWERRNQETRQTKEFNLENEPLFGQPYKTNKGDELSNRIKKMLGSYEVGNNSCPFSIVPFNIPTSVTMSQSYQHQPSTDQSAKPQIHNLVSTENCGPSANSLTSQYARTSTASSPDGREHGKRRRNNLSDPGEPFSPDQEMSAQSPDIKPPPIFHSSVHNNAETFDRQQLPRSDGPSSECLNTMDVSTLNLKQSPKDTPVSQVNMNNTLHSQNFAPLLSSKQPHVIPTQKPTAYVRPNLPELISESDLVKRKTKPPCLEIRRDDQFVEDILKEMTSLWPPLLTTIHTPSTEECPKILFPAKEAEGVSSCPVLKHPEPSPSDSAHLNKRFPPKSCGPTHSSGGESESECDSLAEEPVVPSVKTEHDVETKAQPRKKQKLNNNTSLSSLTSVKLGTSRHVADAQGKKHPKKPSLQFDACKEKPKDSKLKKSCLEKKQGSNKELVKSKESSKHKECSRKIPEQPHTDKPKAPKRRVALASTSTSQPRRKVQSHRPLLSFDERKCPVKHYIKEAKRLKHQADAESDKLSKAYNYLDAAMFFVESGIAMEKDPQISKSSYTMFAETVELLRFVLKLKHSDESLSPPAEKDFLALCLKCLSLLQMAMFRHKYPTALKYSKVLTEHFDEVRNSSNSTSRVSDLSSPNVPSPSSTSVTGTSSVAPPQTMNQVSLTYVNITTLVLNAHEVWDQMEELEHRGSGLLAELDALMGPLTLSSSMSSMVRYTRQGVHWLRHDTKKL